MKLKLKLTKNELGSLLQIAKTFVEYRRDRVGSTFDNTFADVFKDGGCFFMYSYLSAFESFLLKYFPKFSRGTVREKRNLLTLSDMESLAFYHICRDLRKSNISPYEEMLIDKILGSIAKQVDSEVMLRMSMKQV